MVRAVVLAAGTSSRMGRPKAGLPLSDRADTFLNRILRTLRRAGVPDIVVVTGAAREEVRSAAGPIARPIRFAHNHRWQDGQLTSLLAGLDAPPGDLVEAVVVSLVDAPLAAPATVMEVLRAWRLHRAPMVRPARGGVHGHPVVFDRVLFDELRAADPSVGAKAVVRAHAAEILDVPVSDPGAFVDFDTPEDYERLGTRAAP